MGTKSLSRSRPGGRLRTRGSAPHCVKRQLWLGRKPNRAREEAPGCRRSQPSRRPKPAAPPARRDTPRCHRRRVLSPAATRWIWRAWLGRRRRGGKGRVLDLETNGRARAVGFFFGQERGPGRILATQSSMAFRLALDRAMSAGKPPMDSAHFRPSRASSTHSMEGVLMVSPWKIPAISLPPLVIWKIFGSGRSRRECFQPLHRSWTERDHAMRAFPAQHLLPGPGDHVQLVPRNVHREYRRGGVADGEPGAVRGDPVAVWNSYAGGGSVPGENDIAGPIHCVEIGKLAVIGFEDAQVFQLELALAVGWPSRC